MPQIKLKKEVLAHMELSRLGSVMAKDREPEWRTRNPLLGTVLDIVDSVLAFGPSPTDAGGPQKAIINVTPMLKHTLAEAFIRAPRVVRESARDPRTVTLTQKLNFPKALGYTGLYSPEAGKITIAGLQSRREKVLTTVHELRHFLTEKDLVLKDPKKALETAEQIGAMLPPQQRAMVGKYVASAKQTNDLFRLLKVPTFDRGEESLIAYSESLSYLNEALLTPAGNTKFLHDIADSLGVGIR